MGRQTEPDLTTAVQNFKETTYVAGACRQPSALHTGETIGPEPDRPFHTVERRMQVGRGGGGAEVRTVPRI
eukprot:562729-Alexandrium_andersonii.AAC.1